MKLACQCAPIGGIFKARYKKHTLIDRERAEIKKLRVKLRLKVKSFLQEQAPLIAAQVVKLRAHVEKDDDEELKRILRRIDLDGWDALSGDIEPILTKIIESGGLEALMQLGITDKGITDVVNENAVKFAEERAGELITRISESTRNMIREDIAEAMREGYSNDRLASTLEDNYAFSGARSELIARTETAYADVQGSLEGYRASGVVVAKEWLTAPDCCDLCDELNGVVVGLDEPFPNDGEDGPPLHPNCFSGDAIVSAVGVSRYFKRWFAGEVVVIGAPGIADITVTPNHPILTHRGWVKAGELQLSDSILQCLDPFSALTAIEPNHDHIESRFDEMFRSWNVPGGVRTNRVPMSAEDFHGDGIINTHVDVVTPARFLQTDAPNLKKSGADQALLIAEFVNSERHFSFESSLVQRLDRTFASTHRVVSGGSESQPIFGAGLSHSESHALAAIPNHKAEALPPIPERAAVATDAPSYINARLAGHVSLVQIGSLSRRKYDGHVYNLETNDGWYFVNGIIAHNCRCDVLPVLDTEVDSASESEQ